jgi:hypothetical protein
METVVLVNNHLTSFNCDELKEIKEYLNQVFYPKILLSFKDLLFFLHVNDTKGELPTLGLIGYIITITDIGWNPLLDLFESKIEEFEQLAYEREMILREIEKIEANGYFFQIQQNQDFTLREIDNLIRRVIAFVWKTIGHYMSYFLEYN